jgi:hypothetical protein
MSVIINGTTGISTDGGSDLFGTGTIGGSLTLTSGTANGVTYLNGSKVLTSGSGVTFDGTNLGVGANITASASSAPSFTVGTGSGSPAITLYSATNLQSQISFADATTGSGAYDGYLLYEQAVQNMVFGTAATERMRLTSTGLGIGTSSPAGKLQVGANGSAIILDNVYSAASPPTTGNDQYIFRDTNDGSLNFSSRPGGGGNYKFWNGATQLAIITNAGNVGIGTSSPAQKLHISNNGNAYQLIDSSGIANGYNAATLYKNSERQYRVGTLGTVGGFAGGALVVYDETAAAWRMVINSAGNVGIGTTSISGKLSINGEVYAAAGSVSGVAYGFYPKGTYGNTGMFSPAANTVAFATTGGERVRIDSSGNVGIATSSPNFPLSFGANVGKTIALFENAGTSVYGIGMGGAGSAGDPYRTKLFSNGSERMAITDTGNVLVGTTTSSAKVTSSSSASGYNYASVSVGNQPDHIVFKADATTTGSITRVGGTGVAYNTSSDYRLKEDWVAVADASTRVNALKPVNFAWKVDGSRVDGFLAHELAEVVPEAVTGEKDAVDAEGKPVYQGIDQSKLVPLLTAALQEALARIETLEADVATLKGAA